MKLVKNLFIIVTEGIRYYFVICNRNWWRQFPYLPLPSIKYIKWRLDTAYGASFPRPSLKIIVRDISKFLLWRHKVRQNK